jgi:DNA repair protein RadA/Sms
MTKIKTVFICEKCDHNAPKWLGKCPRCNEWNTLVEEKYQKTNRTLSKSKVELKAKNLSEFDSIEYKKIQTGVKEFDRALGGGVTEGSLTLLGGEPGIGKSTLLMEICGKLSNISTQKIFYVSGEESESQIADRSKRLGINFENFYILNETSWQDILINIKELKPKLFVLDSIQTTVSDEISSSAGSISQIREVTYELMNFAKNNGLTCIIIGHVTKDGNLAGPKVLEHMVDTVVYFEGDQFGQYRLLRVIKNRFGNTNEIGIFEMKENGLKEISNPSQYFLDDTLEGSFGRSLSCVLEGSRPLFAEIQALVVENKFGNGKRTTQGMDGNRLSVLVAVIEKYFKIPLSFSDVYLNVVGGLRLKGRDTDLAVVASLLSSHYLIAIPKGVIFLGEIGLTGEVRSVSFIDKRVRELEQLNYNKVITSMRNAKEIKGNTSIEVMAIEKVLDLKHIFFNKEL